MIADYLDSLDEVANQRFPLGECALLKELPEVLYVLPDLLGAWQIDAALLKLAAQVFLRSHELFIAVAHRVD
ncbi:MAG: hypothetical protein F4Y11_11145, partial [Chloroflexi bacterium]|nr:hypothetical protein [Chloroflexota bacterium]